MAKLQAGDKAPDFDLPGTGGRRYRLANFAGSWLVLAFYPADETAVCTRQFCSYRDNRAALAELDAELLGVSPQGVDSHESFAQNHGLTVPLLADEEKTMARAYGTLGPAGLVRRAIFIIDPEGVVRHRKVALLSLGYEDVDAIAAALEHARDAGERTPA